MVSRYSSRQESGISFGVTGDFDTVPDVQVVARGIERAMVELVRLADGEPDETIDLTATRSTEGVA